MKRILSIFLITVLLASVFQVSFASDAPGFISKLGVDLEKTAEKTEITRGEFADIAARLYFEGIIPSENATSPFTDVGTGHHNFKGIYTLSKLGIISGNGGVFRPDDSITFAEVITIILKSIGYDLIAESNGGWPSGYLYTATINGILNNVSVTEGNPTGADALEMLFNSLFLETMEVEKIENDGPVYKKTGKSILTGKFNAVKLNGVVTDDGFMSFDNQGKTENNIIRLKDGDGNVTSLYTTENIFGCFGKNCDAYAKYNKETDTYELLYISVSSNASVTSVEGRDIIKKSTSYIEYEIDKETAKSKTINFSSPYVFLNGKKVTSFNAQMLKPENGFLEFVDNESDGKADVIFIWNFDFTDVVENVDAQSVSLRKNPVNNIPLDEENTAVRFIKEGKLIDYSEVLKDNVLSVCKADIGGMKIYFAYVSTQKVKGTVTSVEDKERITIETVTYDLSPVVISDTAFFAKAKIGESNTFYIDCLGNIVYCDRAPGGDVNYFYIINIFEENSLGSEVKLCAYTQNAVIAEYVINTKAVTIDGKRLDGKLTNGSSALKPFNEIRELLNVRPDGSDGTPDADQYRAYGKQLTNVVSRPAIYKVNSKNEIVYIDTDAVTHNDSISENNDSYALKPGVRYIKDTFYLDSRKTLHGRFFIDETTLVMKVADIDRYNLPSGTSSDFIKNYEEDISDDKNYSIYSPGELTRNSSMDIQAYNINPETGAAGLVLIRGAIERGYTNNDYRASLCVFDSLTNYYDADREKQIHKIYYYNYGNRESAKVDPDTISPFIMNIIFGGSYPASDGSSIPVDKLQRGDVIYINVAGGYLTHLNRDLDISKINDKSVSGYHSVGAYNPYYATNASIYMNVPYDIRNSKVTYDYGSTYVMDLAIPYSVSGNIMVLKKPAASGASQLGSIGYMTYREYIESNGGGELISKFIDYTKAGITVVEEISHSASGECEYKVREGSISDIRFMNGYSEAEGLYKASRVFTYDEQGNVTGIIILNLLEEHNHVN